ncbi:MAG: phage holin family protein [Dehalococcoidia bacterium]|nr:phage holin family protein [Dehalococcoidia bacterium]
MGNFSIQTNRADRWGPSTLALRFVVNLAGLWIASEVVPGVHVDDLASLLAGTAIFAIVNVLLRPLANLVSCCLIVFTFGLFVLIINTVLLAIAAWVAGRFDLAFRVDGFWAAFFGALVISVVSLVASLLIHPPRVSRS